MSYLYQLFVLFERINEDSRVQMKIFKRTMTIYLHTFSRRKASSFTHPLCVQTRFENFRDFKLRNEPKIVILCTKLQFQQCLFERVRNRSIEAIVDCCVMRILYFQVRVNRTRFSLNHYFILRHRSRARQQVPKFTPNFSDLPVISASVNNHALWILQKRTKLSSTV